jgi:hypothetical protein
MMLSKNNRPVYSSPIKLQTGLLFFIRIGPLYQAMIVVQ